MDELQSNAPVQSETNDLQAEFEALRHLVVSLLILLIVVSGTFTIYLLRQWRTTSKDLQAVRPQVEQMVRVYQKDEAPWMQEILNKFVEYGRTHPDYMPVLANNNIQASAATGAPPAQASPPATTPKKK